jgi:hypothetical protein
MDDDLQLLRMKVRRDTIREERAMTTKIYDNRVAGGTVNVPGKPGGYGDTMEQPAESGATSTKVQEPPAEAETKGPQEAKVNNFTAPPTSPLKSESNHMPGSDSTPHL